jgi:NAD(P)-dependent dehydrogenase (short-subunit alcohol dehydrogenase family)
MSYNATKAAIIEMSKSMAVDLGSFSIRVNCVCPGITHTPAVDRLLVNLGVTLEEAEKTYAAPRCIIKRFGKPEEVAAAILFVASDEASYITGATLVVDGGFTA